LEQPFLLKTHEKTHEKTAAGIRLAAVFSCKSACGDSFVQTLHQGVDVDAVRERTLLDVLEVRGGAADAAHAGAHEYGDSVRIFPDNLSDAHIFRYGHTKTSFVTGKLPRSRRRAGRLIDSMQGRVRGEAAYEKHLTTK